MSEDRIREALRAEPTATEREAEERAWRVVSEAFEQRSPTRPRRSRRALVLSAVGAAAIAGLVLSPAGAEVREWIADAVEPGVENAAPTLAELPGGGRMLVQSGGGTWTVAEDGSLRSLGDYDAATFSPQGPFAAAGEGDRLLAVVADPEQPLAGGQPAGTVRWSIPAAGPISSPRWSPSGFRISYLSARELRVVAGDGTGDKTLDPDAAPVAPAWRPRVDAHHLAYVDAGEQVMVVDADGGPPFWASRPLREAPVQELAWSSDGTLLAALSETGLSLFTPGPPPRGRSAALGGDLDFPARTAAEAMAVSSRDQVALIRRETHRGAVRSELILIDSRHPGAGERRLFAGPGRFTDVAFSPNGEWVLLGWKDADQWVFIRPRDGEVRAVSDISAQFDPGSAAPGFPRVEGWCCPTTAD